MVVGDLHGFWIVVLSGKARTLIPGVAGIKAFKIDF
jgi:hypothetical protein